MASYAALHPFEVMIGGEDRLVLAIRSLDNGNRDELLTVTQDGQLYWEFIGNAFFIRAPYEAGGTGSPFWTTTTGANMARHHEQMKPQTGE